MSFFSARNICAGYGKRNVVTDVSFDMDGGCLLGILGGNGSGKTTLLKAICGILPHEGECVLNGDALETQTPRQIAKMCSYIPQRSGISIDISAIDVVLMGFNPRLGLLEHPNTHMREKAVQKLKEVGLEGKENTDYLHLSEGQKQLCILARTLVSDSKLLLLDEPESALDFHFRYRMLELLRVWVSETGGAAVIALHDPSLALNYCDRLLLLSEGRTVGTVCPRTDPLGKVEGLLRELYGGVSLQECLSRSGRTHLVMIKEDVL